MHRKSSKPPVLFGNFIQIAPNTGNGHRVLVELQSFLFESCFRLQHSISCLLRPARFGNHNDECLRESVAYPIENAIETLRVGVVEKGDVHGIVWRAERICQQLPPKSRAADPN